MHWISIFTMILIAKCKVTKTGKSALCGITKKHTLSIKYTPLFTAHEWFILTGFFAVLAFSPMHFSHHHRPFVLCATLWCVRQGAFFCRFDRSYCAFITPFGCSPPLTTVPSTSGCTFLPIPTSNTLFISWVCRGFSTLFNYIASPWWQKECVISCTASSVPRNLLSGMYCSTNAL